MIYMRKTRTARFLIVPLFLLVVCSITYMELLVPRTRRWVRQASAPPLEQNESSSPVQDNPGMLVVHDHSRVHPHPNPKAQVPMKPDPNAKYANASPAEYDVQEEKVVARPEDLLSEDFPSFDDDDEELSYEDAPQHQWRSDGLLAVNPDGSHPIYELIERAEEAWNQKLKRASKTLSQAVSEYQRRYHRLPPKGFDEWWWYVKANDVQLPDEYDQIYHDLEPFWGMTPKDLQNLASEWEAHVDSFVIGKKAEGEPIDVLKMTFQKPQEKDFYLIGGREIIELLRPVENLIPPFRAIFSPHDNPNLMANYELRKSAVDAAAAGTYIDIEHPPPASSLGWLSACPPHSPARRSPSLMVAPRPVTERKTFIHDHRKSMDPCLHPSHLSTHGQFLSHNFGPHPEARLYPQFSWCVTDLHSDLRAPTPANWREDIYPRSDDPEWADKVDERLLWRGSNTGIWHGHDRRWWGAHRERLVEMTGAMEGGVRVLMPDRDDVWGNASVGEGVDVRKRNINAAVMDVHFAGKPLACEPETCEILAELFDWRPPMSLREAGRYKYVMDIDGNGWSSRYKRLITSNSLIFKSTIYSEWFQDRIQPWVHYVPIQVDLSDLYDAFLFFRGDMQGEGGNDFLGQRIAQAGRDWSKRFWRKEDLTAYMFRMLLEYARVMSLDRDAMTYVPSPDDWPPSGEL